MKTDKSPSRVLPVLAAVGFVAVSAAFALAVGSFRASVVRAARESLDARAARLAGPLGEAVRTQDFPLLHRLGDECRAAGDRLTVYTGRRKRVDSAAGGGVLYDNLPGGGEQGGALAVERSGEGWAFRLAVPVALACAASREALPLVLLAVLVGIAGMLFVFFGFYRQRAQLRAARRHLDELSALERERREFIADFSHELKTPLTGIIGAAEMLGEAAADRDAATVRLTDMITRESRRLNSLAQQILDLSRLGNSPASAAELVARAVDQLVENARRHSGTDDIAVTEADRGAFHCWIVEDHGVGVPPELRERIFERFFRIDPARAQASGGAGLGLAIVRGIARRLGGDCVCEAAEPKGARFVLSVPRSVNWD